MKKINPLRNPKHPYVEINPRGQDDENSTPNKGDGVVSAAALTLRPGGGKMAIAEKESSINAIFNILYGKGESAPAPVTEAPLIEEVINEETSVADFKKILKDFVAFTINELDLQSNPKIVLKSTEKFSPVSITFGTFNTVKEEVTVSVTNRHPMDVLRSVAHELVHHKQLEEGRLEEDSGETGSDIENEANAKAGVILRKFGQNNPQMFTKEAIAKHNKDMKYQAIDIPEDVEVRIIHKYNPNLRLARKRFADQKTAQEWVQRYKEKGGKHDVEVLNEETEQLDEVVSKAIKYYQNWKDNKDRRQTAAIQKEIDKRKKKQPRSKYTPRNEPKVDRRTINFKRPTDAGVSVPSVKEEAELNEGKVGKWVAREVTKRKKVLKAEAQAREASPKHQAERQKRINAAVGKSVKEETNTRRQELLDFIKSKLEE